MGPLKETEFFETLIENLFSQNGGRTLRQPAASDNRVDMIVEAGGNKYVIELKQAAEGRRDRLIPLLSQAILQAQAAARRFPKTARPVAIVAARHISHSVAEQVKLFAMRYAENVGVGIIDSEGLRLFRGYGLERFNSERLPAARSGLNLHSPPPSHLFSDLHQWMLKILLAPSIPEHLLSAPREQYQNGSQLAKAASVSVMSASRFIRQLANEGFLDERKDCLRLVRIEELLKRWVSANLRKGREIPARWIIRGGKGQLKSAIQNYISWQKTWSQKDIQSLGPPIGRETARVCVGVFAASDLLGYGFVHGVGQHIYLDRIEPEALSKLGLSLECDATSPDVFIRIPENHESVFRAVVKYDAVPVSDVLQVWLDVSHQPERGQEQAEQIWKRVLAPSIDEYKKEAHGRLR